MNFSMLSRIVPRALAAGCLFAAAGASQAAGVYAPYVDVTLYPTPLVDQIGVQQGIQQFMLAFVVSGGNQCTPSWGGVQPIGNGATGDLLDKIATSVTAYRAKGGDVAVSFGGAAGQPLMQACSSVAALKGAYQTVIDTYSLTHVDFDIEGASQQDSAAVARNFQAVAQLQADYAAKGKPLHVTLTLPAMPTGLVQDGLNVLNAALANNVTLDAVNIMTMDYGPSGIDMGAAAISAAQGLYSQLDTAYKSAGKPQTDAQLKQLVGVTPMIGVNDVAGEIFTLANAQSVQTTAANNSSASGRSRATRHATAARSTRRRSARASRSSRTRSRRSSSNWAAIGARASPRTRTTAAARTAAASPSRARRGRPRRSIRRARRSRTRARPIRPNGGRRATFRGRRRCGSPSAATCRPGHRRPRIRAARA